MSARTTFSLIAGIVLLTAAAAIGPFGPVIARAILLFLVSAP